MGISVRRVHKCFGAVTVLGNVSVDVPDGSLTALLGPSGSGTSTLLRVSAGLEQPDQGEVQIGGQSVTKLPPQQRGVGFVFQHDAAFKHMPVRDNVGFGLRIRKRPKAEIRDKVDELLKLVQLDGYHARYPAQLSGGQRQPMALARALAVEPRVLLLDEPFGALDARVREELRDWLRRLHEKVHVTTVLVIHDQEEAMEVASRIAVMNHGAVEQAGSPAELYEHPATEFVMGFVGKVNRLGNTFIRPHEVVIRHHRGDAGGPGTAATVERLTNFGYEVRVDLTLPDGERVWARLLPDDAAALALHDGQTGRVGLSLGRMFGEARVPEPAFA